MGLCWCLQWAEEQHYNNLIFENDTESVAKALFESMRLAAIGNLILHYLQILAHLENTRVLYVSRICNNVVHSLAALALDVGCKSRVGNVPNKIMNSLCKDSFSS